MRYIVNYYNKNKTLARIPNVVIFEGVELRIDSFLADRRKKHKKYITTSEYKPS